MFETSISKALNDAKVEEQGFTRLQTCHLEMSELASVDQKLEAEIRARS